MCRSFVSRRRALPSVRTTRMSSCARYDVNAIHSPSGDTLGNAIEVEPRVIHSGDPSTTPLEGSKAIF